ncbi:unnamed protein product, partial [Gongylonema pulchrum]
MVQRRVEWLTHMRTVPGATITATETTQDLRTEARVPPMASRNSPSTLLMDTLRMLWKPESMRFQ